jgi:hypothetical protein
MGDSLVNATSDRGISDVDDLGQCVSNACKIKQGDKYSEQPPTNLFTTTSPCGGDQ